MRAAASYHIIVVIGDSRPPILAGGGLVIAHYRCSSPCPDASTILPQPQSTPNTKRRVSTFPREWHLDAEIRERPSCTSIGGELAPAHKPHSSPWSSTFTICSLASLCAQYRALTSSCPHKAPAKQQISENATTASPSGHDIEHPLPEREHCISLLPAYVPSRQRLERAQWTSGNLQRYVTGGLQLILKLSFAFADLCSSRRRTSYNFVFLV